MINFRTTVYPDSATYNDKRLYAIRWLEDGARCQRA